MNSNTGKSHSGLRYGIDDQNKHMDCCGRFNPRNLHLCSHELQDKIISIYYLFKNYWKIKLSQSIKKDNVI